MGGNFSNAENNGAVGAGAPIAQWPYFKPSLNNSLVYLYAGNDLNDMLSRVVDAGGKISTDKTFINKEIGYYSTIIDTEGNKVSLHSMN